MKKSDLKSGMLVVLKKRQKYLVLNDTGMKHTEISDSNILLGIDGGGWIKNQGWMDLSSYHDDLSHHENDYSIDEVLGVYEAAQIGDYRHYKRLWHRSKTRKYEVVTLCGSTRFKDDFIKVQKALTLKGCIVMSVGLFGHSGDTITDEHKIMLDDMHKHKIDMADVVFVINKDGYIGESTESEIEYAENQGKQVVYLEGCGSYEDDENDILSELN